MILGPVVNAVISIASGLAWIVGAVKSPLESSEYSKLGGVVAATFILSFAVILGVIKSTFVGAWGILSGIYNGATKGWSQIGKDLKKSVAEIKDELSSNSTQKINKRE